MALFEQHIRMAQEFLKVQAEIAQLALRKSVHTFANLCFFVWFFFLPNQSGLAGLETQLYLVGLL